MRSILVGISLLFLGGPSWLSPYVAVSPGERGSPLRSREQRRRRSGEQSSSSCAVGDTTGRGIVPREGVHGLVTLGRGVSQVRAAPLVPRDPAGERTERCNQ